MGKEGVPMTPTTVPGERTGPEDALGSGLKRGDYTDRQPEGAEHFEGDEHQNPNVEEIGDTKGKKGGVESQTKAEQEAEEAP